MPVYKLIKDGVVINTIVSDLEFLEKTKDGWDTYEEVILSTPSIEENIEPPKTWSQEDVRSKMTFSEKTKWDTGSTPEMVTAKIEFSIPKELQETTNILNFLVETNNISQDTANNILT